MYISQEHLRSEFHTSRTPLWWLELGWQACGDVSWHGTCGILDRGGGLLVGVRNAGAWIGLWGCFWCAIEIGGP